MTKVLEKSFAILEAVVEASPMPVPLMELAKRLRMNKATCSRLALELAEMGYLEKHSHFGGFMAGPRAWSMGKHARYAESLIAASDAPVKACAQALGQSVMLVVMRNGIRYILTHHNFNPEMPVKLDKVAFTDAFNTASGLVQLAYSSEEEFQAALALRDDQFSVRWNERGGDKAKDAILSTIHKDGILIHESSSPAYPSAVACPVFKRGEFIATVGVSMPRELLLQDGQKERFSSAMLRLAETISSNLSQNSAP